MTFNCFIITLNWFIMMWLVADCRASMTMMWRPICPRNLRYVDDWLCSSCPLLLQWLEVTYGFNGTVLEWLRSYVEDRMQSVHLNSSISRPRCVICRVSQESVLGPSLSTQQISASSCSHLVWNTTPTLTITKFTHHVFRLSVSS